MKKLLLVLILLPFLLDAKLSVEMFRRLEIDLPIPPCDVYRQVIMGGYTSPAVIDSRQLFPKDEWERFDHDCCTCIESSKALEIFDSLLNKFIAKTANYHELKQLLSIIEDGQYRLNAFYVIILSKEKTQQILKEKNITVDDIRVVKKEVERTLELNQPSLLSKLPESALCVGLGALGVLFYMMFHKPVLNVVK